jgi:preprotein translocase subunit SecG
LKYNATLCITQAVIGLRMGDLSGADFAMVYKRIFIILCDLFCLVQFILHYFNEVEGEDLRGRFAQILT